MSDVFWPKEKKDKLYDGDLNYMKDGRLLAYTAHNDSWIEIDGEWYWANLFKNLKTEIRR